MGFESMPVITPEGKTPEPEVVPVLVEQNQAEHQAEREAKIEQIEQKRAGLLARVMESRMADGIGNWIPGINVIKLGIETAIGKTSSGKKISGLERIAHGVEAAALLVVCVAISKELAGSGGAGTNEAALMAKFVANAANLYINKEFVLKHLREFATSNFAITERLIAAVAALPESVFSNQIIQLKL